MRSFFKLPGTALLAVAALFAVVASSSTANAFTFRAGALPAAVQSGPESVQDVAVNWWQARHARHNVVRALNQDCRGSGSRSQWRECYRDARDAYRQMVRDAREAYRECVNGDSSRRECRQALRQYWIDQANGGSTSGSTDTADTADTGGADTGGGMPTDLPQ